MTRVWIEECIPESMGTAVFTMLYKQKGSPDDPSKYRCIGLLNSAYKVLSSVMLRRINKETTGYLQDWQAGFRQRRGCRDNVMILRTAINAALREDKPMILTFIDYSAAFDSVGHKFLDKALGEAKAKAKTRAIFRSIYNSATARTKVKGTDGEYILSDKFPVRRGVIQGDLTSPIYFIIALEAILRRHDKISGKVVDFGGVRLHTLGYADDAALIDDCTVRASERVTSIARGSKKDADMQINISKTKCMHVKRQQRVHTPNKAEATNVCKFKCNNVGCGWVFGNKHGLKVHQGKWCKRVDYQLVERLLDVDTEEYPVGIGTTKFLVKWRGYGHDENTWEPYENITKAAINECLEANGKYDYQWKHRCPRCDKPCRSARGAKIHYARKCKQYDKEQHFEGTVAKRKHTMAVLKARHKQEADVECEGEPLENCFTFRYLGSMFAADGTEDTDLRRRIGMATTRCGQLRFVLGSNKVNLTTKLKIYKCAVGSLFTYGSEAWNLSAKTLRMLNGANAGCLHRFTGKTRVEEAREVSCTYSLCKDIRKRRAIWLGHILRMHEGRLVRIAAEAQHGAQEDGNLFKDAPAHTTFAELVQKAKDRTGWRKHIDAQFGIAPGRRKRKKRQTKKSNNGRWIGVGADAVWIGPGPPPNLLWSWPSPRRKVNKITKQPTLPADWQTKTKNGAEMPIKAKKKTKSKPKKPCFTDAQRAAWAHAHFIVHHGDAADARRFLTHPKTVANTPADTLAEIRKMAVTRVPTWEQAAALVFSSSDSGDGSIDDSDSRINRPPPIIRDTCNRVPTWEQAAALVFSSSEDSDRTIDASDPSVNHPTSIKRSACNLFFGNLDSTKNKINATTNTTTTSNNTATTTTTSNAASETQAVATHKKPAPTTAVALRYRTRSTTAKTRKMAATAHDDANTQPPLPSPTPARKRGPKKRMPAPSACPKSIRVAPSKIPGAGLGLYLMEAAKEKEWIARYSGEPLTKMECDRRRHSHYRVQVHKNLYLDAEDPCHFEGRYINDARHSQYKTNARFAAGYGFNICASTGYVWVRIYATRAIKAGEELFIDYGKDFWDNVSQNSTSALDTSAPVTSIWAAPAPCPDSDDDENVPTLNPTPKSSYDHNDKEYETQSWATQAPAPASPTLLGHYKCQHQPTDISFPQPPSPIPTHSNPNSHPHMIETYSFTQMYDPHQSILLPMNVTSHRHTHTHTMNVPPDRNT